MILIMPLQMFSIRTQDLCAYCTYHYLGMSVDNLYTFMYSVYVCMHVCVCTYVCVYMHVCRRVHVCMCAGVRACMYVWVDVCRYISINPCLVVHPTYTTNLESNISENKRIEFSRFSARRLKVATDESQEKKDLLAWPEGNTGWTTRSPKLSYSWHETKVHDYWESQYTGETLLIGKLFVNGFAARIARNLSE